MHLNMDKVAQVVKGVHTGSDALSDALPGLLLCATLGYTGCSN